MQREEAEDVVQEVMIKLWNNRENLAAVESLDAYSMTICRNLALDHQRKQTGNIISIETTTSQPQQVENPYSAIYAKEDLQRIDSLMAQLPEKQRLCMQFRDFEGRNYKEIANIMQITEDQVKINIFRARKFVKDQF